MIWNQWKGVVAALVLVTAIAGTAGMLIRGSLATAMAGQAENNRASTPARLELAALDPQAPAEPRSTQAGRKRSAQNEDDITIETVPPVVVKTVPQAGASDVDPDLREIRVTFSKAMVDKSWSWSTLSRDSFPKVIGEIHYLPDRRTCVLPVKLEPGRTYATWINSDRFTNFKDTDHRTAVPYLLVFQTRSSPATETRP